MAFSAIPKAFSLDPPVFPSRDPKASNLFDLVSSTVFSISRDLIRPCHKAAMLSRETKKALFYHAKPRSGNHGGGGGGGVSGKTKLFWSPGTIWPPCDKGECSPKNDSDFRN